MDSKSDVEKALEYQKECLTIIERYIDPVTDLDRASFLRDCHYLTRAHYDDLVAERACADLCGYVPCRRPLSQTSGQRFGAGQKYHIKNKRVFDITRRRNFCSDRCFANAEFLREQMLPEPVYLRKKTEQERRLELYDDVKDKIGDEVDIGLPVLAPVDVPISKPIKSGTGTKPVTKKQILRNEKAIENRISAPYAEEKDLRQLQNEFKIFDIKERTFDKDMVEIPKAVEQPVAKPADKPTGEKPETTAAKDEILDGLTGKMSQWFTEETARFLHLEPKPIAKPEPVLVDQEDPQKKLERYRWEYIKLVAKLDREELEDQKWDEMVLKESANAKKKSNKKNLQTKRVRFKDGDEEEEEELEEPNQDEPQNAAAAAVAPTSEQLFMPLDENHHASIKRRWLFLNDIDHSLSTVFPMVEGNELREQIRSLIRKFRLESTTVILGQRTNRLVAIILVRILMQCQIIDPDQYGRLFDPSKNRPFAAVLAEFDLTIIDIDNVVQKLLLQQIQ